MAKANSKVKRKPFFTPNLEELKMKALMTLSFVYNFSGIQAIWEKQIREKPSTFLLWVIGVHAALFGIASQRYENRIDVLEYRGNAIISQLGSNELRKSALKRIPIVQRLKCPQKPELLKFWTVYVSLVGREKYYSEMIELLIETTENNKSYLDSLILNNIILEGSEFNKANFNNSYLIGANFNNSKLFDVNFSHTIQSASFENAKLRSCDFSHSGAMATIFKNADIYDSNMKAVALRGSDFSEAKIINTDFRGSTFGISNYNATKGEDPTSLKFQLEQLSKASTLYKCQFDSSLMRALNENYPKLFTKPDWIIESKTQDGRSFRITDERGH